MCTILITQPSQITLLSNKLCEIRSTSELGFRLQIKNLKPKEESKLPVGTTLYSIHHDILTGTLILAGIDMT